MERWEGAVRQVNRSGRADYWLRGDGGGWRAFRTRSAAARRLFAARALPGRGSHSGIPRWLGDALQ